MKVFILAFEITFIFVFFLSVFWNPLVLNSSYKYTQPLRSDGIGNTQNFYINRGYPFAWAGTAVIGKPTPFPIVKLPFRVNTLSIDGSRWAKVIDLTIFIPSFLITFIAWYHLLHPLMKKIGKAKHPNYILVPIYFILLVVCIFAYSAGSV